MEKCVAALTMSNNVEMSVSVAIARKRRPSGRSKPEETEFRWRWYKRARHQKIQAERRIAVTKGKSKKTRETE